ncbi:MAG: LCCL domain-containing protein [Planctomycetales bacterium]
MNRLLLSCAVALLSNAAAAQPPEPIPAVGPVEVGGWAAGEQPAGLALLEGENDAFRRQLVETLQSRLDQLSPEQLRRVLEVIESDGTPLPPAAEEVLDVYRQQAGAIQRDANRKIAVHRRQTVADLKAIQVRLTRDGQLDEAVAVRDLVRSLSAPRPTNVQPDPGSLSSHRGQGGRPLYFRVTGSLNGTVWGSDVYTADSTLAVAAVHAGVLRNGQTGIVQVTVAAGRDTYAGSTRNGVTTHEYGAYPGSYRVARVPPDTEEVDPPDAPAAAAGKPAANAPAADPPSTGGRRAAGAPPLPGQ